MSKLLSVCMIVKDEEDVLKRCLESLKGLADEIIIVDTGSTDSTKEVARQFTEHVYDFQWVNDFSVARNESIKYATGQWILVLDADEYANPDDAERYRLFLQQTSIVENQLHTISVVSYVGRTIHNSQVTAAPIPRLFPNFQGIYYYRPIHEQLTSDRFPTLFSSSSPITVYHTGYLRETVESKNKSERNNAIFTALKQKSGFTNYDYFTLGNEHAMKDDWKKALYNYEKALRQSTEASPWRFHCAFELSVLYNRQNRVSDSLSIINGVFADKSQYPEYHCLWGMLYETAGLSREACQSYIIAFQSAEKLSETTSTFWLVNPSYGAAIALSKIVYYSLQYGNYEDVVFYSIKLLQSNPHDYSSLVRLLEIFTGSESAAATIKLLERIYPEGKQHELFLLFKIFTSLGQHELASFYYGKLDNKDSVALPDKLKYALLCNDQRQFKAIADSLDKLNNKDVLQLFAVATLVWGEHQWLQPEKLDEELRAAFDTLNQISTGLLPAELQDKHLSLIYSLLVELLTLSHYEHFDRLVSVYSSPALVNKLASYFYNRRMSELAIDYFNLLLDNDALDANNYVYFAMLHFEQGLNNDGVILLKNAIAMEPQNSRLYTILLEYCTDAALKKEYKDKYIRMFPHAVKIPGVADM